MPNPTTIDIAQIADGLERFAADREAADHAARTEQQRLAAIASAEQARQRRETDLAGLSALEAAEVSLRADLASREKQMNLLWSEILTLRTRFQTCLAELQRKRERIGL